MTNLAIGQRHTEFSKGVGNGSSRSIHVHGDRRPVFVRVVRSAIVVCIVLGNDPHDSPRRRGRRPGYTVWTSGFGCERGSRCGYTSQYTGLQALYERYKDQGLVVVGVPCNQFMGQEPGTAKEIASFCKMRYGVTFPLLEKQNVNGNKRSALYQSLVNSDVGGGAKVGWNFEKFLVDRTGTVVARFNSGTKPGDVALVSKIESLLRE